MGAVFCRAGRGGKALTLITQYEVDLVQAIEAKIGKQLTELPGVDEDEALTRLQRVTTAQRLAKMRLHEQGFDDVVAQAAKRKRKSKNAQRSFAESQGVKPPQM